MSGSKGQLQPPDGGWGWLVTLGATVNMVLSTLITACFSIIYSQFLLDMETSSGTIAWIYSLQWVIFNLIGISIGPLQQEFGWRKIAIVGGLMNSASFTLSAFAPSAEFLYFSYSILSGFGTGASLYSSALIVANYFTKKRGKANGIVMAGIPLGAMLGAPFTRYLVDQFGFKGGSLIISAIYLHACAASALFHPEEWHKKRVKINSVEVEESLVKQQDERSYHQSSEFQPTNAEEEDLGKCTESSPNRALLYAAEGQRMNGSHITITPLHLSRGSAVHLSSAERADEDLKQTVRAVSNKGKTCGVCAVFGRILRNSVKNLRILKKTSAVIVATGQSLALMGHMNFLMMVPFAMQANGHTLALAAWCISLYNVFSLITRLIISPLSDLRWFHLKIVYTISFGILAVSTFVFPVLTDIRWLMVSIAVAGIGSGTMMGLFILITIDVLGIEHLPASMGNNCFVFAIIYLSLGPLTGYIRDVSDSYKVSMWVCAGLAFLSFCLWLLMPASLDYERGKKNQRALKRKQTSLQSLNEGL